MPYSSGHLDVGGGHQIYMEQSGNAEGIPVVFIHGGPGGGTNSMQRRFFDPKRYRIILFDQRGCGKSRPHAELKDNTTAHLIADMEAIRTALDIDHWLLFGGSWGSTLALLYAEAHPERVTGLILRGIFLGRQSELDWFYGHGTSAIFPDRWADFIAPIPEHERGDMIMAYYKRLTAPEYDDQSLDFARAWSVWEGSTVTLEPGALETSGSIDPHFARAFARIEAHYFINKCFLTRDNQILDDIHRIAHLPAVIVQGRYDAICPPLSAWELADAMPSAQLKIVPVAGHSAFEAPIRHELLCATDAFAVRARG